MKLIFCRKCEDVVKAGDSYHSKAICACGCSWGHYVDDINAVYGGEAVPLGIANPSLLEALRNQPEKGMGRTFEAFVIPVECPTFKKDR